MTDNVIPFPMRHVLEHGDDVEIDHHEDADGTLATAIFDREVRQYRYLLTRQWAPGRPLVFLMLNPSTATAFVLDPTVTRCIGFAKREGYPGIAVLNIFALRARHPGRLKEVADPIGPLNDEYLLRMTAGRVTVCAWGNHGVYLDRGKKVARMLTGNNRTLVCLKRSKDGHPGHPLYLRGDAPLLPFDPR